MMKVNNLVTKQIVACLFGLAISQAAWADGIQKLGFIDTERVYRESKQAQHIEKTLQQEFASRQAKLQDLQRAGAELEQKAASDKLSPEERQQVLQRLGSMVQQFRTEQAQLAEDFNLRRNEEFAALQASANKVIIDLAKQEGYDLIIQDAIYVNGKFDITDKVIRSLNH